MKTFDQCKDEVANKENYVTWDAFESVHFYGTIKWRECNAKAAELYAQEVAKDAWERACDEQRKLINIEFYTLLGIHSEASKPPYQPNQEKP
jgi:hypothetical protein